MCSDLLLLLYVDYAFPVETNKQKTRASKQHKFNNHPGMTSTTAATSEHLSPLLWWLSQLSANPDRSHLGTEWNLTRQNWYISKPTGSHLLFFSYLAGSDRWKIPLEVNRLQQVCGCGWMSVYGLIADYPGERGERTGGGCLVCGEAIHKQVKEWLVFLGAGCMLFVGIVTTWLFSIVYFWLQVHLKVSEVSYTSHIWQSRPLWD